MNDIYKHPNRYDLEHRGDDDDVKFYIQAIQDLRPRRVLELGCGTGRISLPLAREGHHLGLEMLVGLDNSAEMLERAKHKLAFAEPHTQQRLCYIKADMLSWQCDRLFDLITIPCNSISHVLELSDQIRLFQRCYSNLNTGGRLIVEATMPNLATYADSFRSPPRATLEVDLDNHNPTQETRLIRRKTTSYSNHQQLAAITFFYEKYQAGRLVEGYVDDFASHVFFPRELALLFLYVGFRIERILGDYQGRDLDSRSSLLIIIGKKLQDCDNHPSRITETPSINLT